MYRELLKTRESKEHARARTLYKVGGALFSKYYGVGDDDCFFIIIEVMTSLAHRLLVLLLSLSCSGWHIGCNSLSQRSGSKPSSGVNYLP